MPANHEPTPAMTEILTASEAVQRMRSGKLYLSCPILEALHGLTALNFRRWAYKGWVPSIKIGSTLLCDADAVQEHIASGNARVWVNGRWEKFSR